MKGIPFEDSLLPSTYKRKFYMLALGVLLFYTYNYVEETRFNTLNLVVNVIKECL